MGSHGLFLPWPQYWVDLQAPQGYEKSGEDEVLEGPSERARVATLQG